MKILILEDPDFVTRYGSTTNWNGVSQSNGYGQSDWTYQPWSSTDWFYNSNFSIDLVPAVVDNYDFQATTTETHLSGGDDHEAYERAGTLLGLTGNWSVTSGASTSPNNHGFDLLWSLMGWVDGPPHGGNNRIFVKCWNSDHIKDEMFHIMQHELGHPYGAKHVDHPDLGYPNSTVAIMGKYEWNTNFNTHLFVSENYTTVTNNSDSCYDGL